MINIFAIYSFIMFTSSYTRLDIIILLLLYIITMLLLLKFKKFVFAFPLLAYIMYIIYKLFI